MPALLSSNCSLALVSFPDFNSYLESANWKNSKLLNSLVPILPWLLFVGLPSPETVTLVGSSESISIVWYRYAEAKIAVSFPSPP